MSQDWENIRQELKAAFLARDAATTSAHETSAEVVRKLRLAGVPTERAERDLAFRWLYGAALSAAVCVMLLLISGATPSSDFAALQRADLGDFIESNDYQR